MCSGYGIEELSAGESSISDGVSGFDGRASYRAGTRYTGIAFAVLYYVPPKPEDGVYPPAAGCVFTSVAWAVFSYVFSIYLEYASNMSVLYGSLTTLVVVMLWLYFCMYLLFIGAEINQYLSAPELFTLDR